MQKYKEYSVDELVNLGMLEYPVDGNHGELHPKVSDYVPVGVPFVMANDLVDGRIDYQNCNYISEEQAKSLRKGFAIKGDVLLTHKGTIGRTAIVDDTFEYVVLTPQVTYYRVIEGIDNRYLKYYFDSSKFQNALNSVAGAGSTRAYLGIVGQRKLPIVLPSLSVQRDIANILGSIDDKIQNNRCHINVLDEVINRTFKHWFIDFEFPNEKGHPYKTSGCVMKYIEELAKDVPEKWIASNVFDNVIEVKLKNKANNEFPVLSVVKKGEFKPSDDVFTKQVYSNSTSNYKVVEKNQVAYNPARANIGSIAMLTTYDYGLVSPIYVVFKMSEIITPKYFYYFMKRPQFVDNIMHHAIGTTRQNFSFTSFKEFELVIPPLELQYRYSDIVKPMEEKIDYLKKENETLSQIRDTLLPKLLSGELSLDMGDE